MRRVLVWLAVAIVIVVVAGGAWLWINPQPIAERLASGQFGRQVRVERLAVGWDRGLSIRAAGMSVANAPWGSTPDMVRVDSLAGEVALWPLLRGELRLGKVSAAGLRLVLEHGPDGRGNWKREGGGAAKSPSTIPVVADFALTDAELTLHTSSGARISITGREAILRAPATDRPVSLEAEGAYNNAPVKLSAVLQPGEGERDARIRAIAGAGTLTFDGKLRDPLDFDGVAGRLRADIGDLGQLLALFGLGLRAEFPLALAGELTREGDSWKLAGAHGQLAGSDLTGELALDEGERLKPDKVRTTIDLAVLDLDALDRQVGARKPAAGASVEIVIDENPSLLLDAVLGIGQLRGGPAPIADLRLHASLTPGRLALDDFAMAVAGGHLTGAATVQSRDGRSHLTAQAAASGAEAEQVLRLAGVRNRMLTGALTARAVMATDGRTLQEAWRGVDGQVVLAMAQGRVSRRIMALASTDVRELFGAAQGLSRVSCLLAVMVLRDGKGEITPFRIRSADGTLFGGGSVDLVRETLDLTLKTEGRSTGLFALDLPVRVTGSFDSPDFQPAINSPAEALRAAGTIAASRLREGLRELATGSPCLR